MGDKKGRVVVAMSGGVDSSVAAALLKEEGWEVIGITLRLWDEDQQHSPADARGCCAREAVDDARRVAQTLGLDHYVLNMKEPFRQSVVEYFVDEYRSGRTPNPCIACNSRIKFTALLQKALAMGASFLATGHYARVEHCAQRDRYLLRKGIDGWKDQSYMLYDLSQDQLRHCIFPLGGLTKQQVRARAGDLKLAVAGKSESQEICFIPDNDYRSFLRRYGIGGSPGPIINSRGAVVGEHSGIAFYTIGQRRGLGLVSARPLYVLEISPAENTLVVGERDELLRAGLDLDRVNLIAAPSLEEEQKVDVKIRYKSPAVPALLNPLPQARAARIIFERPQAAVTPGQAAVFYQDDLVLGGGVIKSSLKHTPV